MSPTHQQAVDVPTEVGAIAEVLLKAPKQLQNQALQAHVHIVTRPLSSPCNIGEANCSKAHTGRTTEQCMQHR